MKIWTSWNSMKNWLLNARAKKRKGFNFYHYTWTWQVVLVSISAFSRCGVVEYLAVTVWRPFRVISSWGDDDYKVKNIYDGIEKQVIDSFRYNNLHWGWVPWLFASYIALVDARRIIFILTEISSKVCDKVWASQKEVVCAHAKVAEEELGIVKNIRIGGHAITHIGV